MKLSVFLTYLCLLSSMPTRIKPFAIPIGTIKGIIDLGMLLWDRVGDNQKEQAQQILDAVKQLNSTICNMMNEQGKTQQMITDSISKIVKSVKTELRLNLVDEYISIIETSYNNMMQYAMHANQMEPETLRNFAKSVLSEETNSIKNIMDTIHEFIISPKSPHRSERKSLFVYFLQQMKDSECSDGSQQQLLYELYRAIIVTEIKVYSLVQFSYHILIMFKEGSYTLEIALYKNKFKARCKRVESHAYGAMQDASASYWKCDPDKHKQGETYVKLSSFMQGYIVNEKYLNKGEHCRGVCENYDYVRPSANGDIFRGHRRCQGNVTNCQFKDSKMTIFRKRGSRDRRYDYIEFDNGLKFGERLERDSYTTQRIESWSSQLFWQCSYCMCICNDESPTALDIHFNLRSAVSDLSKNRVITGVRFIKKNHMIQWQVQEGELQPNVEINLSTRSWVPLDNFQTFNGHEDQDYYKITMNHRDVDIDDIVAPPGYAVTGVRFKKIGTHLRFEIRVTPFDWRTGQLIKPYKRTYWIDNIESSEQEQQRKKITINAPDIPTKCPKKSRLLSSGNQYVELLHSDMVKDVAQTIVPFFDIQKLESTVPLRGIGIYYKGWSGYGGFIGPKIITYDYSNYLGAN